MDVGAFWRHAICLGGFLQQSSVFGRGRQRQCRRENSHWSSGTEKLIRLIAEVVIRDWSSPYRALALLFPHVCSPPLWEEGITRMEDGTQIEPDCGGILGKMRLKLQSPQTMTKGDVARATGFGARAALLP